MSDRDLNETELLRLASAYKGTFKSKNAKDVLAHLESFCHAKTSTHVPGDPCGSAQLEGRRQVWLLIQQLRELTEEQAAVIVARGQL